MDLLCLLITGHWGRQRSIFVCPSQTRGLNIRRRGLFSQMTMSYPLSIRPHRSHSRKSVSNYDLRQFWIIMLTFLIFMDIWLNGKVAQNSKNSPSSCSKPKIENWNQHKSPLTQMSPTYQTVGGRSLVLTQRLCVALKLDLVEVADKCAVVPLDHGLVPGALWRREQGYKVKRLPLHACDGHKQHTDGWSHALVARKQESKGRAGARDKQKKNKDSMYHVLPWLVYIFNRALVESPSPP